MNHRSPRSVLKKKAFIPASGPYTMTPEMAADAAGKIKLRIPYPNHQGDTDVAKISEQLNDVTGVEVRIRPMK